MCGFILFAIISTDIYLRRQIKTHQHHSSVYPGGVLRSRLPALPEQQLLSANKQPGCMAGCEPLRSTGINHV